jgi:CitMHS family citrate-Mg2+:H+ or citrate-Ca2+:H+ symporter
MLAGLGFLTIFAVLVAILSRRMMPLMALIAIPAASALIGGFGLRSATFMAHGIQSVAGVAGMFIFAILYFGVVSDGGMLDPIIDGMFRAAASDPVRIVIGT